ncbi:MAG: GIY-YIG nuclease family protein [Patescibacteria group bacterium]
MKLIEQAKKLPLLPGVYLFINKKGKVLYVGRAISLRKRVLNYFQKNLDQRIGEMVNLASKINYQKTGNILEAIILEANLIKKYWPKYNIKEKDDRSFLYVVISKNDYPRPIILRGRELKKFYFRQANVFGPYTSLALIKNALKIIRRIFPYGTCRPNQGKPCFDYQIGLCPGACIGAISKNDYQKNIKNIILMLSGQHKKLIEKLKYENPEKIKALRHIQDVALITKEESTTNAKFNRIEGYDISHLTGRETYGSLAVFISGQPDKASYRLFKIKNAPASDDLKALKEIIVRRFKHLEWPFPDLILIDGGKPQVDYIEKTLKDLNINIALMGISKLAGDKLVFPAKTKKSIKESTEAITETLIELRDEAHRFALKSSRISREKGVFGKNKGRD